MQQQGAHHCGGPAHALYAQQGAESWRLSKRLRSQIRKSEKEQQLAYQAQCFIGPDIVARVHRPVKLIQIQRTKAHIMEQHVGVPAAPQERLRSSLTPTAASTILIALAADILIAQLQELSALVATRELWRPDEVEHVLTEPVVRQTSLCMQAVTRQGKQQNVFTKGRICRTYTCMHDA